MKKNKLDKIIVKINECLSKKECVLIAIDGRCGSGKTELAGELGKHFKCNVIHADDFFLRPQMRTSERLAQPGGNLDRERLLSEVLVPAKSGKSFSFRPFLCSTKSFGNPINIISERITIVEGSYSCHPDLWDYYDIHIFVDITASLQTERILKREGEEKSKDFFAKWIPLEEKYFLSFNIKENSELVLK